MKVCVLALLLSQVVTLPRCEDAVDAIKDGVAPTPDHSCGCEYYKENGRMWNMEPCDVAGNKKPALEAKHMCCASSTCRKVCF